MSQPQENPETQPQENSVKEIAEALRDATSQLRAIINDLTNPLLRVSLQSQSSQAQQKQQQEASLPQQPVQQVSQQPSQLSQLQAQQNLQKEMQQSLSQKIEELEKAITTVEKKPIEKQKEAKLPTSNIFKLLSLVSDLYMLPKEFFEQSIDAMKSLGYLTQQEADAAKKLLNVMIMASDKGLTPNESLALIALMLNELSGENNELVKDSLEKIVINKLKRQEEVR